MAWAVDALSIPWGRLNLYMFPPFTLIPRCLNKLRTEKASGLLIAPVWSNQVWFPQLLGSLVDIPLLLPPLQDIVTSVTGQAHPLVLEGHLPLAAWPVSGETFDQEDFRRGLSRSSDSHGGAPPSVRTQVLGECGAAGVVGGVQIPFQPL